MNTALRITLIVIGTAFVWYNFYLLIKKNLSERSAIIWIFGCLWVLVIAAFPRLLNLAARMVGVDYPPSLLYLVGILVLLTLSLYQSIQLSALEGKLREIGSRLALLEYRMSNSHSTIREDDIHTREEAEALHASKYVITDNEVGARDSAT